MRPGKRHCRWQGGCVLQGVGGVDEVVAEHDGDDRLLEDRRAKVCDVGLDVFEEMFLRA